MNLSFGMRLLGILLAMQIAVSPAFSQSFGHLGSMGRGFGHLGAIGKGGGSVPFALDGNSGVVGEVGSSFVLPLTTANGSGVIVVGGLSNSSIVSVTAAGLTFTQRATNPSPLVFEYTAPYTTNFSGNITVTTSSASGGTGLAFGISGAKTASYFDPNVSLPALSATASPIASTTNANDFIFALIKPNGATSTPGTGWTLLGSGGFFTAQYQIVTTIQSGLVTTSTPNPLGGIIDAIVKGP